MSKDHILLLSTELRAKVAAKVEESLKICEKHYKQKFDMPEIRYDIKNTHGGVAIWPDWVIRLNLILLVENEEEFIKTTVPHEVAHLINRKVNKPAEGKKRLMPHGREWKSVMAVLDVPARTKHNYDCTSIAKGKKRVRKSKLSRVERIMNQVMRLTEIEQVELKRELRAKL